MFGDHTNMEVGVARKLSISIFFARVVMYFLNQFLRQTKGKQLRKEGKRKRERRKRFQLVTKRATSSCSDYSVKLPRLVQNLLLVSDKCDAHVGKLLSGEPCDLQKRHDKHRQHWWPSLDTHLLRGQQSRFLKVLRIPTHLDVG